MNNDLKSFSVENLFKIYTEGFATQESISNAEFYIDPMVKTISDTDNLGLIISTQSKNTFGGLITKMVTSHRSFIEFETSTVFPLYIYSIEDKRQILKPNSNRTPNLNMEIVNQIAEKLELVFVPEKEPEGKVCFMNNPEVRDDYKTTFAPIHILDYIYAMLHSPNNREKNTEFRNIKFPRVPYPKNAETFWQLVSLGKQIREIHLLEDDAVENSACNIRSISTYPADGNNRVENIHFQFSTSHEEGWPLIEMFGRIYINSTQYFDVVPAFAWEFHIGYYQPAQKWLEDRKGKALTMEDIRYYRKIIVALTETDRLMKDIDKIVPE